ncbi:hypothetical protein AgCh_001059 [Apium graveolens]
MKLKKTESDWIWISFKYENIPTFCFICGLLGHSEKFCARLFDTPAEKIIKPYGIWMKAPLSKQVKPIGAQWLHSGGGIGGDGSEVISQSDTQGMTAGLLPTISGNITRIDMNIMKLKQTGDNRGIRLNESMQISSKSGGNIISSNAREGNVVGQEVIEDFEGDNNGLNVMDLKRRRLTQPSGKGLNESIDTVMIQSENDDPKNLQKAGLEVGKRPNFIFLCETLCDDNKVQSLRRGLGYGGSFSVACQGRGGGLAMLWRDVDEAEVMGYSQNHIDITTRVAGMIEWRLTGLYGEPNRSLRENTWNLMRILKDRSNLPWVLMGDFNNVTSQADKRGGLAYPNRLVEGFQSAISDCNMFEIDLLGHQFTWERGRGTDNWAEVRLDRAFGDTRWMDSFQGAKLFNMDFVTSDHCPILLDPGVREVVRGQKVFRFENAWTKEPVCAQIVKEVWDIERITKARQTIKHLQGCRDEAACSRFQEAKQRLADILDQREIYWRQRSKQLWLKSGNKNTKYFHASANSRHKNNLIHKLKNDSGDWVDWDHGLANVIVDYFSEIFASSEVRWQEVIECIHPTISENDNIELLQEITGEEVRKALFSMNLDKSPGPDGMTPAFYQKYWQVMGRDVIQLVRDFFVSGTMPVNLNDTVRSHYHCRGGEYSVYYNQIELQELK